MIKIIRGLAVAGAVLIAALPAIADEGANSKTAATNAIWKAILDVGEPENSRAVLLEEFKDVVRTYPNSEHVEVACKYASILHTMVRQDQERKKLTDEQYRALTPHEQAKELIFQLRDQNGRQNFQPGYCNIFSDSFFPGKEDSPAHQLLELGVDAIPALIESVDDPELSRCVEFWRDHTYSHHVLTVGHCCVAILEEISGQRFFSRQFNNPVALPGTKRKIEEWWTATGRDGYQASLFALAEIASTDSAQAARQLARVTPEAAVDAIRKAIPRCHNSGVRYDLVEIAASITSSTSTQLLIDVKNTPDADLSSCWVAISELWDRGEPNVLDDTIAEWRRLSPSETSKRSGGEWKENAVSEIIAKLASTGNPQALTALAQDLDARSLDQQFCVVFAFAIVKEYSGGGSSGGGIFPRVGCCPESVSGESLQIIERLAGASLNETRTRAGLMMRWDGHEISKPRLCDIAAYVLAVRCNDNYSFDLYAPVVDRDTRLNEIKKIFKSRTEELRKQ